MLLNFNHELIGVEIIRSNRTTLCISIKEDGGVVVKAPQLLTEDKIRDIINNKAEWILLKRKEVLKNQQKKLTREYVTGATLPYMGKELPMEIIDCKKSSVIVENNRFIIHTPNKDEEYIQKLLKKWYKKQALDYISRRVVCFSQKMHVSYASISIKSRKKQWGSCDNHGNLTFSWRLIMATEEAIDYVVVHELCHRKHMDHSKQFWCEVKKELSDYKEREKWLNDNSLNLML